MIKAILFDFGGVYVQSPFNAIDEVALEMQVDAELLKHITFGEYHIDGEHPWHRLERGEITLDEARLLIIAEGEKHQLKTDIYEMLVRFANVDRGIRGPLVDKTIEWKQRGYKIAMVTNNIKEFTSWREAFPFVLDDVFDVVADSGFLGVRKPNAGIFEYALNQLQLKPEETLFLDDYPANVAAANALGIHGFVVDGPITEAIAWVDKQLKK
jgi:epoxide hydrolase-like predicted phosphatase